MNEQNLATEKTLWRIAAAVAAALAGVLGLSAYVVLTQISRPVSQLARIMQRLDGAPIRRCDSGHRPARRGGHHGPCVAGLQEHDGGRGPAHGASAAQRGSAQAFGTVDGPDQRNSWRGVSTPSAGQRQMPVSVRERQGQRDAGAAGAWRCCAAAGRRARPMPCLGQCASASKPRLWNGCATPSRWTLTPRCTRGRIALAANLCHRAAAGGWQRAVSRRVDGRDRAKEPDSTPWPPPKRRRRQQGARPLHRGDEP